MYTGYDLRVAAEVALKGNGSLQSVVRDILNENHNSDSGLRVICVGVADFRNEQEPCIRGAIDPAAERKKVNNIINDISRICREITGKSIVATKRKPSFVYEPKEPVSKAKASPVASAPAVSSPSPVPVQLDWGSMSAEGRQKLVQEWMQAYPITSIGILIEQLGDNFVEAVKEAKDVLDNSATVSL